MAAGLGEWEEDLVTGGCGGHERPVLVPVEPLGSGVGVGDERQLLVGAWGVAAEAIGGLRVGREDLGRPAGGGFGAAGGDGGEAGDRLALRASRTFGCCGDYIVVDMQELFRSHPDWGTQALTGIIPPIQRLLQAKPEMAIEYARWFVNRRAYTLQSQAFGPDHPGLAVTLDNRAQLYQHLGRYEEAEALLHRLGVAVEVIRVAHGNGVARDAVGVRCSAE